MADVGVIGVGSIGSVLAHGFDELGHGVRVNDTDPVAIDALPYAGADKAILATWADVIVIAVPTPTTDDGGDASAVESVLNAIGPTDATVAIRSTMPPGETGRLATVTGLPLVYSPEFLRDRSDVSDFFEPDRLVIAGPERERSAFRSVIEGVEPRRILETDDYLATEIAKEAHNAFFATKVSFANQIRAIADVVGADPQFIMDVVTADRRNTTSHLDPMLGPYGGRCLPKDTEALRLFARQQGVPTPLIDGAVGMNALAKGTYDDFDIQGTWPEITVSGD